MEKRKGLKLLLISKFGIFENSYFFFKCLNFSCEGDSGAPLQIFRNQFAHIVGIVSIGIGCGTGYPTIYTRVAHYVDWIESRVWPNTQRM